MSGARPELIRFPVGGMTCASCAARITRSLRGVDGVTAVRVDLGRETATVRRDPLVATDAALSAAVIEAGYVPNLPDAVPAGEADLRGPIGQLLHAARRAVAARSAAR